MTTPAQPALAALLTRKRLEIALLICASAIYFFAYLQRVAIPGQFFDELQSAFMCQSSNCAGCIQDGGFQAQQ